jgi:PhzF family phenazine biosynthesis protein
LALEAYLKKFRFKKLDAFASGYSSGNPAAAVYPESFDDITQDEMLRIAKELKGFVSEVGYICRSDKTDFKLRYFSSEKEVEFCGHATIAIMYDMLKENPVLSKLPSVTIETNKGVLDVENRVSSEDCVFITAPIPEYTDNFITLDEICEALGISPDSIRRDIPVGIVNAGNQTLCVPIKSLDAVLRISPGFERLRKFCSNNGLDVVTVFTDDVSDPSRAYRTRVFAAPFGYLEDPATGSGNAALGYYLLKCRLWRGEAVILEQNNDRACPNIIRLASRLDPQGHESVIFGGSAITRIDGFYQIP